MELTVLTYDGYNLQDSNFTAYFPSGAPPYMMVSSEVIRVPRHAAAPFPVDITLDGANFPLYIKMLGTAHSQLATLKSLFDPSYKKATSTTGTMLRRLIVKDTADSDKNWYMDVFPVSMRDVRAKSLFIVNLYAPDPTWIENTQSTDSWSITASGQTHDVTTAGTRPTPPLFEITPTAAKTGTQYIYFRYPLIYNTLTNAFPNYPINIVGDLDTTALVADTTVSNQINDGTGISDSDVVIDIDVAVGGGLAASGMGKVDSEQISWTANSGAQLTGVTRGVGGTTPASHADNAVIAQSKALANGNDFRVFVDGVEVTRWFGSSTNAFNQATTRCWIVLDLAPKVELTVGTLADTGDVSFQSTKANKAAIALLPPVGRLLIENEVVTYTSKDIAGLKVDGETRGAYGTTAAAHTAGVTARWLQYEIKITYGNEGAAAPEADDTKKPIFGPNTSSNTSWVYSGAFATNAGKRAGEWRPALLSSRAKVANILSRPYTADENLFADPATTMGMSLDSFLLGTKYQSENASIEWRLTHPAGATTITATGEKYRVSTSWPGTGNAGFQYTNDVRSRWLSAWTEATPSVASSWEALSSHSAVALGATYKLLRFYFSSSIAAGSGNTARMEIDAVTLTLASGNVPSVTLNAEQTSSYDLNCTITNIDTGEYITVRRIMKVNQTLQIDCENRKVTLTTDNSPALNALTGLSTVRQDWLNLLGATANTLSFVDTGTAGVTFVTKWRDRQN